MRRLRETRGFQHRGLLDIKWSLVLLGGGLLIGLAAVLDPILAPYLGDFNAQAALIAGGVFVIVGYVVTTVLKLVGR
jgi:hypothetical protein